MLRYYILATFTICLFLKGFFPLSNQSNSSKDDTLTQTNSNLTFTTRIDKTVLMIIDALRIDFITPELMPHLSEILQTNNSCFNRLHVEMPTVTLPRIKAITTGSVPQFIDILLNLAHVEILNDSLLHQAYRKQRKVIFYGDDTWLKLFPHKYFTRSEGVSSFYVNDFTEVDDNVTRHLDIELHNNDWDIMILHYLGLDHIGHVYGPKSHLISNKLKEMDRIFVNIHKQLTANHKKSLIMLTSDHGMKDSGGHGGSTYHETNVPLILTGMQCYNGAYEQIDVPANLAVLLGLDIPETSIGQIRRKFLGTIDIQQHLEILKLNTMKLRWKLDLCVDDFTLATHLHDLFLINHRLEIGEQARELYENCSKLISETLMKSSVNQNLNSLIISLTIIFYILLKFTIFALFKKGEKHYFEEVVIFNILILQLLDFHENFSLLLIIIITGINIRILMEFINGFALVYLRKLDVLVWLFVLHPLIFISSSFIEEEHQFWYFFVGNLMIFQILHDYNNNKLMLFNCLIIIGIRFLRTMNQTGDQYASCPDLSDWLLQVENYHYLQLLFVASLVLVYKYCLVILGKRKDLLSGLILVLIYIFRTNTNDNVHLGRILWFLIIANGVFNRNRTQCWVLIISLLLKPYNTILIPFTICASMYFKEHYHNMNLILTHLCLANAVFFCQGNGNSLANIDVSTGYIGLSDYQPVFVFLQVFSHTYSFPILVNLLLIESLQFREIVKLFFVLFYQRIFIIFIVFVNAFIQRQHLFIWSVFAPKIIVETSHFIAVLLQMCCFIVVNLIKTRFC